MAVDGHEAAEVGSAFELEDKQQGQARLQAAGSEMW